MFDHLDLMLSEDAFDGPMQMALDEVLLRNVSNPTLRIYRWSSPCISFGYFQKIEEVKKAHPDLPVVRRWTGGGMVMHGNKQQRDLTFSLMIPSGNRATERSPALFYKQLHHAIAEGISSFIDDEIRLAGDVDRIDGPSCFIAPARDDLMCQGRKILGGAQRRSAGALLYQGSLQGMEEPWEEIGFPEAIAQALSGSLSAIMLHRASIQEALLLAEHRYRSEAWNNRW